MILFPMMPTYTHIQHITPITTMNLSTIQDKCTLTIVTPIHTM